MKLLTNCFFSLIIICFSISCKKSETSNPPPTTVIDSFSVAVTNGYGSGKYKTGDTVHIFTSHYSVNQLFDKWSGDTILLNAPAEWHTWFVMPNKNVNITGSIKTITPVALQLEMIRGRDRLKPVYYYFPAGHKGFVFLLHGTGGSAASVTGNYEFQQLIKDLDTDNFGVVVTEAEEATTGIDANGDGKLRWLTYPVDTVTNVDYVNIRIITDTFYNRGITNRSKFRYSIGMSNGGGFSSTLSAVYKYKAGISYCAPGGSVDLVTQTRTNAFQYCMARFDNNTEVGPAGNADALANFNLLNARGICSKYFIKERAPIYPERFARRGDITPSQSIAVFNELKSKNYIGNKNYYVGFSDAFITAYQSNPAAFPVINSLTTSQKLFITDQVDLSVSDHQMYSDFNRASLKFLNMQCQ